MPDLRDVFTLLTQLSPKEHKKLYTMILYQLPSVTILNNLSKMNSSLLDSYALIVVVLAIYPEMVFWMSHEI